jgi:hypothetical protein
MLKGHPQIYAPPNKEPYFLADELRPPAATPRSFGHTPTSIEEYLSLFAPALAEQRTGEASAPYLWSRTAARRIAEMQPDARIIAILREPASFLYSLHLQLVQIYIEPETDFAKAIALEQARRAGRNLPESLLWGPRGTLYSEYVRYVEQLRRYHDAFGPEHVLVLIYDDFRADNEGTVRQVLRFLGVEDASPVQALEANPTVAARSRTLHELVHTVAVGRGPVTRAVKQSVKALTPDAPRRRALHALRRRLVYGAPPADDEELMAELRRRYRGEVVALSEYLQRDLVGLWGYDDVG